MSRLSRGVEGYDDEVIGRWFRWGSGVPVVTVSGCEVPAVGCARVWAIKRLFRYQGEDSKYEIGYPRQQVARFGDDCSRSRLMVDGSRIELRCLAYLRKYLVKDRKSVV